VKLAALALAALALALTGCETTAEESAKIERAAKRRERVDGKGQLAQHGLTITRPSTKVEVTAAQLLTSAEGAAAVVSLRNNSATTLRDLPIEITVRDAAGGSLYTNDVPGLSSPLVSIALIPAHGSTTWIDDQIQPNGTPKSVVAKIGEGTPVTGPVPQLIVQGTHLFEDPTSGAGAEGEVENRSGVSQQELVVFALARRAGRIVAAGRAVLSSAPTGAATRFQAYFIGDPQGARIQASAPPTTLG
jgi:hypothetical protein